MDKVCMATSGVRPPLGASELASPTDARESALYRLAELAAEFGAGQIASTARSLAERVAEGRFYVACVGQFKRGKSTLLNALIGGSVLPVGVVPVTTVPTILRHGEHPAARVRFRSADWTAVPLDSVEQYVSEEKNPQNSKGVEALEIFFPSPLLATGMCLVDTPGLGSVFAANTAATHAFIPHIDAALVVIGADPPLSRDELQLVDTVAQEVHELLFVLNKADRANEEERSAAAAFARRVLEERLALHVPPIFEVSALEHLEQRGPERDWGNLVQALKQLVQHSGRSLVREAGERGLRRVANQLLIMIKEERLALTRPVEQSERLIAELRASLEQAERGLRDLGVLLAAEQQRLSETLTQRQKTFLKQAQADTRQALGTRLPSVPARRNGPAYRRDAMHLAQEIARAQLLPWLENEGKYAEEAFRKTAQRFVELANNFLCRLADAGIPEVTSLPPELDLDQGLRVPSQFHFHVIERLAAPASPFLYVADLVHGSLGLRGAIIRSAMDFLDQLLEVNSARVQSDVDQRVRESRKNLEAEIKELLHEAKAIAERALARARTEQAAGTSAVEAALAHLDTVEREVRQAVSA